MSVSVTAYGAVGDGATYNDAAIAKAIATGATAIMFPQGKYRVKSPINLTNHLSGALILRGSGRGDNGNLGTSIIGDTGGCIVDATGSQFVSMEDLTLTSGSSSPATCGVNYARSTVGQYAQFDRLKNVSIYLNSDPSANMGNGSVGIYNYGAEIFNADGVYIRADQPMAVLNENLYDITSPYTTTISGQTSMSVVEIGGASTFWAFSGPALRLHNTFNVVTTGLYVTSAHTNPFPYAIDLHGQTSSTTLNFNSENFHQLMTYTGTQENLQLHAAFNASQDMTSSYIVANGSTSACSVIQNSMLSVSTIYGAAHYLIDYKGSNVCGINSSDIYLTHQEGVNMPVGNFSATIHSYDNNPVLNLPGVGYSSYMLLGGRGVIRLKGTVQTIP